MFPLPWSASPTCSLTFSISFWLVWNISPSFDVHATQPSSPSSSLFPWDWPPHVWPDYSVGTLPLVVCQAVAAGAAPLAAPWKCCALFSCRRHQMSTLCCTHGGCIVYWANGWILDLCFSAAFYLVLSSRQPSPLILQVKNWDSIHDFETFLGILKFFTKA